MSNRPVIQNSRFVSTVKLVGWEDLQDFIIFSRLYTLNEVLPDHPQIKC